MLKKVNLRKRILILTLIVFSAVLLLFCYFNFRGVKVEKAIATIKDFNDCYTEEGMLTFGDSYEIQSEVNGMVSFLPVTENQNVKKGDLLIQIDDSAYRHECEIAKSEIASLEAQKKRSEVTQIMSASPEEYISELTERVKASEASLSASSTEFHAAEALFQSGALSLSEYQKQKASFEAASSSLITLKKRLDESKKNLHLLTKKGMTLKEIQSQFYNADLEILSAKLNAAKERESQLEEKIKKCALYADRDARIVSIPSKNRSYIAEGQSLFALKSESVIFVETDVLTAISPYLSPGTQAEIEIPLRGNVIKIPAIIQEIYDYAKKSSSALGTAEYRVHVKLEIPNEQRQKLKGMDGFGVRVRLPLYQGKQVLTLPSDAIFTDENRKYIYQIEHGRVVKKEIFVAYQNFSEAIVSSGINEGNAVIRFADADGVFEGARAHY